jgi:hypothetical protein
VVGDHIILFGGQDTSYLGDTWAWDGTNWTQLQPATAPSARGYASAGALLGTMVLFAGMAGGGSTFDDTWVWNGATWTQATGPAPAALDSSGTMGCY